MKSDDRIDAINRVKKAAHDNADALRAVGVCPHHAPMAILAIAFLTMNREAGISDAESIARLHQVAIQTREHDPSYNPKAKVH